MRSKTPVLGGCIILSCILFGGFSVELVLPEHQTHIQASVANFTFIWAENNSPEYCMLVLNNNTYAVLLSPPPLIENSISAATLPPTVWWSIQCVLENMTFASENRFITAGPRSLAKSNDDLFGPTQATVDSIAVSLSGPETSTEGALIELVGVIQNGGLTNDTIWYTITNDANGSELQSGSFYISPNATKNISVYTKSSIGNISFSLTVDPSDNVTEDNESNNVARHAVFASAWHTFHGEFSSAKTHLTSGFDMYQWNGSDIAILFSRQESIDDAFMYPLTRSTNSTLRIADVAKADISLGMENFSDSLNASFLLDNAVRKTRVFTIGSTVRTHVPVWACNNQTYETGVFWIASSHSEAYDGSQELVFVVQANKTITPYGLRDYVACIPALLRDEFDQLFMWAVL